jgi:hypothetical protein
MFNSSTPLIGLQGVTATLTKDDIIKHADSSKEFASQAILVVAFDNGFVCDKDFHRARKGWINAGVIDRWRRDYEVKMNLPRIVILVKTQKKPQQVPSMSTARLRLKTVTELPEDLVEYKLWKLNTQTKIFMYLDQKCKLFPLDAKILALLLKAKGEVVSLKDLNSIAWESKRLKSITPEVRLVQNAISNLRGSIRRMGYRMPVILTEENGYRFSA